MSHAEQVLKDLLNNIAAERALANPQVNIQPISSGGANYTSELFLATISDGDAELKLFAKVAVVGQKLREQMPMRLFETENMFYTKLANIYKKIQDKHNVPEDKRFVSPEFYGCSDKLYEEIIVLENLTAKGFKVYDRKKSVDWEYAARAMEEIARFHALSIAFHKEHKAEFDNISKELITPWTTETDEMMNKFVDNALSVVKEENRDRVKALFESTEGINFEEICKPLRLTALAHVDFRVSNQMYRRDANGRIELRIVDFQTLRAAPPVLDLLYFIFTSTDEKFRALYYDKLLDHYYSELSLAMKRLDLNPEQVYSREDFDFEFKAKLPFGLSIAVFTLPLVTVDVENAPKVDMDMDISSFTVDKPSDLFPERLNGIVNDFIRWGVM